MEGERIVDRVASALREVTSDVIMAANAPDAHDWLPGVTVLADNFAGTGGLAGVESVLATGRDALVVAWDMPFVTPNLLRLLVSVARTSEVDAVAPESQSPFGIEPFCAWYSVRTHEPMQRALRAGGVAAGAFLRDLPRLRRVLRTEMQRAGVGEPEQLFFSVNTDDDLVRARELAARTARESQ